MSAATIGLEIEQGATFTKSLSWFSDDGVTPIILTGCTAKSQWRASVDDPTVLLELSTENGRIVIDPAIGKIVLHLTSTETDAINFTGAVYDLEVNFTESTGEKYTYRLCKGKVKVSKSVTK